jgi:Fe-S oxidoreductase
MHSSILQSAPVFAATGAYGISKSVLVVLFIVIALVFFVRIVRERLVVLRWMKPEVRWDNIPARINMVIRYVLAQAGLFKEFLPGLMHFLIFWGFMVLAVATVSHFASGISAGAHLLNLFGLIESNPVQHGYEWIKDFTEVLVLLAVSYALIRRVITKPRRLTFSGEAILILIFIFSLMVTDWIVGAGEAAQARADGVEVWWLPVSSLFIPLLDALGETGATVFVELNYWLHILIILVFLNLLPYGKHFHVVTAIPNVFFADLGREKIIKYFDCEDETLEKWGVNTVTDYGWKVMFDAYSCTECGRCRDNCPAYNSGKSLDPKRLNLIIKQNMMVNAPLFEAACAEVTGKGEEFKPDATEGLTSIIATEDNDSYKLQDGITHDMLWACTTCGHCVESCPLLIEHVHKLVDLRRYLVMSEANFPAELNELFKGMENNSNPWGIGQDSRTDWIEDGLEVKTVETNPDFEYLLYLGCSNSFDERNKHISNALIRILNEAGVNYAYLGTEEYCCGETARRLGNEFLGNIMVSMNLMVLNGHNVKKILSPCPHCFHTLQNEYPQYTGIEMEGVRLDGEFEVYHTTQFIKGLVDQGTIKLGNNINKRVVFHDSCYLGRYNHIYDEPRDLIKGVTGSKPLEAATSLELGTCCGAGGGRMWLEEEVDQRVNNMRFKQLMETGPDIVCTACPYCMTMITDASKDEGMEEKVEALDFIELVARGAGLVD